MNVLTSNLQPPKLRSILDRPRLDNLFSDIRNRKIITVTAGAGYGKTTLTAKALHDSGISTFQYRLISLKGWH